MSFLVGTSNNIYNYNYTLKTLTSTIDEFYFFLWRAVGLILERK
jgi:hypothetical protein